MHSTNIRRVPRMLRSGASGEWTFANSISRSQRKAREKPEGKIRFSLFHRVLYDKWTPDRANLARSQESHPAMKTRLLPGLAVFLVVGVTCADDKKPAVSPEHARNMREGLALFKAKVRPVLVKQCLDCHGGKATKGDLDLSDREPLVKSGVLEGGSKESRLALLIRHEDEPHMPYKAPKLGDAAIADIGRWIDLGAPYDSPLVDRNVSTKPTVTGNSDFWSFRPLARVSPPTVNDDAWTSTPIDRFIVKALDEKGLRPNPIADRRTLIRRLSFDLTGLPPNPEAVEAFAIDRSPDAYERLVDRLLASPQFGERFARHWMDVARFAESHGYEQDYDRPHAYHYRDFLIRAFNEDMPYDQFVRWQLAGDEWAPDDPMALAATGFLGAGAFPTQLTEAEFESARYNELDDMVATTGVAFLGLTVGCARCHDHKYDPILSEDYYRLAAVFTTTIRSEIDVAVGNGAKPVKVQVTAEGYPHTKHHADERGFPHFYPKTYVLRRGDAAQKLDEAVPGVIRVLSGGKGAASWRAEPSATRHSGATCRRSSLGAWLTDAGDGAGRLAARVIVNRLWQHHLGRGIVATPNDFGAQGTPPSHPELLDWLATRLTAGGWRLKPIHRLIVLSAVYMQSDDFDEGRARIDRENVYLWRRAPQRLEAEPIRDAMLAAAGRLDLRMYGPGSLSVDMPRRSVYFFIKRSQLIPLMMLFDWPEHLVSMGQRTVTTTAPQALAILNSGLVRQCALGFAARVAGGDAESEVARAYRIAFGRTPSESEARLGKSFLGTQRAAYARLGRGDADRAALVDFCQAVIGMNEFIYIP
jgi:mono/diheme cytochrome c family protein